jgi:hypothetical protein
LSRIDCNDSRRAFLSAATRQFESGILDEALRAKAMALVDDDEQKFKKQYISLRVTQLKKDSATRGYRMHL